MLWEEQTWQTIEASAKDGYVAMVPCGAIEQHGPHLPVDTDASIARVIAIRVADVTPKVVVTPTMAFGFSPHHKGFSGTITLSFDTYASVVADICLSLRRSGFHKIILLNSHGGNVAFLQARVLGLMDEHHLQPLVITYWHLIRDIIGQLRESEPGGMFHSGELETSIQLAINPHLVDVEKAETHLNRPPLSILSKDMASGAQGYHPAPYARETQGVKGDPTKASKVKGERILQAVVERMAECTREYQALREGLLRREFSVTTSCW